MALSQEQKKFLNEITYNPNDCFDKLQNTPNYLDSFYQQFLTDGTSLLHVVMSCISQNKSEIYQEMAVYILKKSSISLFDKKDSKKESAWDIFYNKYSDILEGTFLEYVKKDNSFTDREYIEIENAQKFVFNLLQTLIKSNGNKTPEYQYSTIINYLVKNKRYNELDSILKINISPLTFLSSILKTIIENDDIKAFKMLLDNKPFIKEKLDTISINKPNTTDLSNLLSTALTEYAYKISKYFIENFNFPLTGKININKYHSNPYSNTNNQKTFTYPLIELINKDLDLFKSIITKMPDEDFLTMLSSYKKMNFLSSPYPDKNIKSFMNANEEFFSSFLKKIENIQFCEEGNLINFLNDLLNSCDKAIDLNKTLQVLNKITYIDINVSSKVNMKNFNSNIYKKDLSNENLNEILNIYEKINNISSISPENFIVEEMLNYPNHIKKLMTFLNLKTFKGNFFSHVIIENEKFLIMNNENNIKESLKIIYENNNSDNLNDNEIRLFQPSFSLISYCLSKGILNVFEIFSNEDILKEQKNLFEFIAITNKIEYKTIITRLLDLNFNPFVENNNNHFFKFILNQVDKEIIENVLLKYNKNLNDIIDNPYLWSNFHKFNQSINQLEDKFKLLENLNINLKQEKIFNMILTLNNYELSNIYLSKFNNNEEFNSFIFDLNKNKLYNSSLAFIENRPHCVELKNKQKKLSCKYLIKELNKNYSHDIKNLIIKNLEILGDLKSHENILTIQQNINEYPSIISLFPDIETTINYQLINSQLTDKNKGKKLKI